MNIPDIHEQKRQCTEPIADAESNPFFFESENNSKIKSSVQERILPRHSTPNHELDSILDNCPAIINDVMKLQLGPLPREESRWILNDLDVSEKWHLFKEKSLALANREGLFVESHTQQILFAFNFFFHLLDYCGTNCNYLNNYIDPYPIFSC
ncbi:hypothetical protein C1645_18254 [Glomus cerebriforme]|uniref:Uncharacterized protein n=1 Tax=Glomus cerebriforme TaxID=658196 RepID=A0A397T6A3_9GLOM|nr:hypothetical protein C1645_18254 [Glomus cerebriforme]